MPLQNFVANSLPTIKAAWLNQIDAFYFTLFGSATTAAQARAAISAVGSPDIQAQTYTYFTTAGTSTAYTVTTSPVAAALAAGQRYSLVWDETNGANATLARDGLTAKNLMVYDIAGAKVAVPAGSLVAGNNNDVLYDGTDYVVLDPIPAIPPELVNAQTGTTYTYLTGDRGKLVTHTNAAAIAGTLPQAGTSFPSGWAVDVQNRGAGVLTITPTTSTIDGAATLVLLPGQGIKLVSDGTNYFTQRGMGIGIKTNGPVATTSGASVALGTVVGSPRQLIIDLDRVRITAADLIRIRLGNAGGIVATNYIGATYNGGASFSSGGGQTTGCIISARQTTTGQNTGRFVFDLQNETTGMWVGSGIAVAANESADVNSSIWSVAVTNLTRVDLVAGAGAFDNGAATLSWKY